MFSISHGPEGAFRLEIHSAPSDLDPADARRLRAVLLGLAREVGAGLGGDDGAHRPAERRENGAEREPAERGEFLADVG